MHSRSNPHHDADDTFAITTVDGLRYVLADDPTRTVVVLLPDGTVSRLPLAEFKERRRFAAQALRRAEVARWVALIVRRCRILRSTLKWRLRLVLRALAPQRSLP